MTSQGSPLARLARAIETRNILLIESTAAELHQVPLELAVDILLVLAAKEPERYPRAAARLLGRVCLETRISIYDAGAVMGEISGLGVGDEHARQVLRARARTGSGARSGTSRPTR